MRVENNVPLSQKTTFGIGGLCKALYIPESEEELLETVNRFPLAHLLAGGSNIIISDERTFSEVICLTEFAKSIKALGLGKYEVGASVRNQKLIHAINNDGYGGIEYLYSVPGTIGGAIYMNAGTGRELGKSISQMIESVKIYDGKEVREITQPECKFGYRSSLFQESHFIILSAVLHFYPQEIHISKQLINERLERVKRLQDHSGKTCGTFCKVSDPNIMKLLQIVPSKQDGVYYSRKTHNWLLNDGTGTWKQLQKCIKRCQVLHKLFGKRMELEVELWP